MLKPGRGPAQAEGAYPARMLLMHPTSFREPCRRAHSIADGTQTKRPWRILALPHPRAPNTTEYEKTEICGVTGAPHIVIILCYSRLRIGALTPIIPVQAIMLEGRV